MRKLLIVGENENLKEQLSNQGREADHVRFAGKTEEAIEVFKSFEPNVVLLDIDPAKGSKWNLLHRLRRKAPGVPILNATAFEQKSDDPRAAGADRQGARQTEDSRKQPVTQASGCFSKRPSGEVKDRKRPDLEELKARARDCGIDIRRLSEKAGSVGDHEEEEYRRAMEKLMEKQHWIQQDLRDYEIIGESGWEDFGREIETAFARLEDDCRRIRNLFA
jgi:CheY-like chemotaxis protein